MLQNTVSCQISLLKTVFLNEGTFGILSTLTSLFYEIGLYVRAFLASLAPAVRFTHTYFQVPLRRGVLPTSSPCRLNQVQNDSLIQDFKGIF